MGFRVGAVFLSESRCIQRKYDGGFVLVAQDAKGSGLNDEMAALLRRQAQPSGDQHPQNMTVCKKKTVARGGPDFSNQRITARRDLGSRFALRGGMEEYRPAWIRFSDLVRGQAFVFSVIPLGQISVFQGSLSKTGQFRRPACPRSRASQDEGKFPIRKLRPQGGRLLFSRGGQREIGKGSVLAAETPFGLPMPD